MEKRGRPPASPDKVLSERLEIRLSKADVDRLEKLAMYYNEPKSMVVRKAIGRLYREEITW